jgi:hypothetical protein
MKKRKTRKYTYKSDGINISIPPPPPPPSSVRGGNYTKKRKKKNKTKKHKLSK